MAEKKKFLQWQAQHLLDVCRSSSRYVLDYECGVGDFIDTMTAYHWAAKGVENDEALRKKAQMTYGRTPINDDELEIIEDLSFSAVTWWNAGNSPQLKGDEEQRQENLVKILKQFCRLIVENGSVLISSCTNQLGKEEIEQAAQNAGLGIAEISAYPEFGGIGAFFKNMQLKKNPLAADRLVFHLKKLDTLNFRVLYTDNE